MLLLAIGLLQSHAGCRELIGDCYQPSLPGWLFAFKTVSYLFLVLINSISVIFHSEKFEIYRFRVGWKME